MSTTLTEKKKLEVKEIKHSRIHALGLAKRDSINISGSQALDDNKVWDTEFKLITWEMMKYGEVKESLRNRRSGKNQGASQPDVEKIRDKLKFSVSYTKS